MVSLIKSVLVHAINAYRGSRGMNPLILNLGNWWRKAVKLYAPAIPPRKVTSVPTMESSSK
jgi:hypothetical protein